MNEIQAISCDTIAINEDIKQRGLSPCDFSVYVFPQVWASTALGFGGMGGQSMTKAMTYVLVPDIPGIMCLVYFAGRFAYAAPYSESLMTDVYNHRMEPVSKLGKYFANE